MKKVVCLLASVLMAGGSTVWAQGEMDAFKYSQPRFNGTARYLSMGGAFGALGGDVSVMNTNPGGLGIYRSSEVVGTISLSSIKSKTDWNRSMTDVSKTKFDFDNISYVGYFPTGNDEGLVSWNVGFAYNRVVNFERSYGMRGTQNYSLADYAAAKASYAGQDNSGAWFGIAQKDMPLGTDNVDAKYENIGGHWIPGLAYQGGLIGAFSDADNADEYHSAFGEWKGDKWVCYSPNEVVMNVREKGAVDKYNLAVALNFSNMLFLGANLAVEDLSYDAYTQYDEYFGGKDKLLWDGWKSTDGTGYSVNIGIVARPADELRLGIAYNSPTWYKITDYYGGKSMSHIEGLDDMNGKTPQGRYTDYKLRTPDRWIISAAGIIGQVGLISVDYELSNYKYMNLSDPEGYEYNDNELIKQDFSLAHSVKVGAEVKVTPQFAVRAGGGWQSSPMRKQFREGAYEVYTAGLIPNYTMYKGTSHFSVGFGYRFTPNFYADMACIYSERKDDAYTFSKVIVENQLLVDSKPATLKSQTTRVALTLGYKF